ncbi:M48 family metalloprotease [archaeon]|jgi:Zn-dependent protease with chaperone function|nr:M48 family metalloprotease [archaeon]MBT6067650.1 M48 family metalloprotease [bacterium]
MNRSIINQLELYEGKKLSEETLKVKTTDETIKQFFPSLWNGIKGDIQSIFPIVTKKSNKDTRQFNRIVKNLETNIHGMSHTQPNAYTLPGIGNKYHAQVSMFIPPVWLLSAIIQLSRSQLKAKVVKNKIIFNNNAKIKMLLWQSKGIIDILGSESRALNAVYLHEIGHWVNYKPVIGAAIMNIMKKLVPALAVVFIVLNIVYARAAEWQADRFAKEVGYGDDLALALTKIGYTVRKDATVLVKIGDYIRLISMKLINIVDDVLPIFSHPSMRNRVKVLQDGIVFESDLKEQLLLETTITDTLLLPIQKLLKPVDKVLGKNVDLLFPFAK